MEESEFRIKNWMWNAFRGYDGAGHCDVQLVEVTGTLYEYRFSLTTFLLLDDVPLRLLLILSQFPHI